MVKPVTPVYLTCPVCQKSFASRYSKKYCSTTCSKKLWTESNRDRINSYHVEYQKKKKASK